MAMRFARANRPAILPLAPLALIALLAGGCGSDGSGSGYGARDSTRQPPTATATTPASPPGAVARSCDGGDVAAAEGLRVTGAACGLARGVAAAWSGRPSCAPAGGASRASCEIRGYRCLAADVEGGTAVSCSRPGSSVAFVARRD
jgi:hypothetical protein